ncbi:Microsomal signal peptidase 12 kDa subunit (SPC12)-containing protein [Spironucleus salmonicida]|uniref:Microsomal signal peptidase 12 kDa subunit (SPC12)-containing protein n=1 Tax=Spironucleus salmonicida TaxID=348837 RepID=V6LGR0_9EUKA|nr:Microsomal signal peptidase 12 kDa subunit (SPC12)-containing protein [Spironucleus salmonicida]KAH0577460.1 Microsomal signal peptidase 12 kDa subunit (SPC12)-containing protein [Spironucleus salmonicida]|eukprot:EST43498.1 Microsomal signal peptidase 12 kDa subunit (SPC12)-containing protein [Spironucleus salmonicida]
MVDMRGQLQIYFVLYGGLAVVAAVSVLAALLLQSVQVVLYTHGLGVLLVAGLVVPDWPLWNRMGLRYAPVGSARGPEPEIARQMRGARQ